MGHAEGVAAKVIPCFALDSELEKAMSGPEPVGLLVRMGMAKDCTWSRLPPACLYAAAATSCDDSGMATADSASAAGAAAWWRCFGSCPLWCLLCAPSHAVADSDSDSNFGFPAELGNGL